MDADLIGLLTQFGAAGLIGFLWLAERRAAAIRDRELCEAHQHVLSQRLQLDVLLDVVKENTRAIEALEQAQRTLVEAVRGWRAADMAHHPRAEA